MAAPVSNRRTPKGRQAFQHALAVVWRLRAVIGLALSYFVVFGWLFAGTSEPDPRPSEVFAVPVDPLWAKPDAEHWFGTTGTGADLFDLSRVALARTVAVAAVTSAAGLGVAFLFVTMFVFDPGERRFRVLRAAGRIAALLPSFVVVAIVCGGAGGNLGVFVVAMALVIGVRFAPVLAEWFEKGECQNGVLSGYVLGLTRPEIVTNRIVPVVLLRLAGVFAALVPTVTLAEMALSFLGLTGDQLDVGTMVARGRDVIIEAPWMAVAPGVLATVVVAVLALLGWLTGRALRTGPLPRWI